MKSIGNFVNNRLTILSIHIHHSRWIVHGGLVNSHYAGSLHLTILRHNHIAKKYNYLTLKYLIPSDYK
jgi:hypothetical protein